MREALIEALPNVLARGELDPAYERSDTAKWISGLMSTTGLRKWFGGRGSYFARSAVTASVA
jgi:hypothetical protein